MEGSTGFAGPQSPLNTVGGQPAATSGALPQPLTTRALVPGCPGPRIPHPTGGAPPRRPVRGHQLRGRRAQGLAHSGNQHNGRRSGSPRQEAQSPGPRRRLFRCTWLPREQRPRWPSRRHRRSTGPRGPPQAGQHPRRRPVTRAETSAEGPVHATHLRQARVAREGWVAGNRADVGVPERCPVARRQWPVLETSARCVIRPMARSHVLVRTPARAHCCQLPSALPGPPRPRRVTGPEAVPSRPRRESRLPETAPPPMCVARRLEPCWGPLGGSSRLANRTRPSERLHGT